MSKKTALLIPALAIIAATSAQAQTTNIYSNAYAGGTIGSGTTSLITNGATITGNITDNGTLLFMQSSAITNVNSLTGNGMVTQSGTGTTVLNPTGLNAINNFAGGFTVTSGLLDVTATAANADFRNVTVNGGVLNMTANLTSMTNLTVNGGRMNLNGTYNNSASAPITIVSGTLSLNKQDVFGTWEGNIATPITINAGGVLQNGTNSANNGYVYNTLGAVTLNGGTIQSLGTNGNNSSGTAFGLKGAVSVTGSGTSTIAGAGFALGEAAVTNTTFNVGSGATLNVTGNLVNGDDASAFLYAGWGNKHPSSLIKTGSGTMILSGTNTYTGTTTVGGGMVEFANTNSLYNGTTSSWTANNITVSNGATLAFAVGGAGQFSTSNVTTILSNLGGTSGKGFLSNSSIGFDVAGGNFTLTNNLGNSTNGTLNMVTFGANTLTLTGSNTYGGTTTISSGTLQVGNGGTTGSLGTNPGAIINNGTLAFNRSDSLTLSNVITGSGALLQSGAGTTTLTGINSYGGTTTISSGTLQVGNGGFTGSLGTNDGAIINNGTLAINRTNSLTLSNAITGSGALLQSGAGTTTLTGSNSYAGTTTISSGRLQVGNGGTSGSLGSGSVTNNGTLAINRSDAVTVSNAISGSGALIQSGAGTTTLTGNNTYTGSTTLSDGVLQIGNGGTSGSLGSGSVTGNSLSRLQVDRSDTATITNNLAGINLRQAGSGTTVLAGSSLSLRHVLVSQGTLMTASNRSFAASGLTVGVGSGDNGTLLIQGQGAVSTTNGGSLVVGQSGSTGSVVVNGGSLNVWQIEMRGTSSLTVSGDSTVTSRGAAIVDNSSVAMSGGLWSNTVGNIVIGQASNSLGSLSISGAGSLINNGSIYVGNFGGEGSILVSGGSLTNFGSLNIGTGYVLAWSTGTGSLTVTGGSVFNSGDGTIGTYAGSTGSALVSGGMWSNGTGLYVGSGGSGSLTLSGTGTVIVGNGNGIVTLANESNSVGTLNLGNGGSSVGTLSAGTVTGGSGNATVNVNSTGNANLGQNFTGSLAFNQIGTGTTTLGGANTYSGLTKVSVGTLALGAGGSLATNSSAQIDSGAKFDLAANSQSLKDVKANGTIAGSGTMTVTGTLSGSGTVNADTVVTGTHSPGNSPGIQSFGGNLTYNTGAGILLQFTGNTTNNSPVNYDQILVGNNLNFNGLTTLNLDFGDAGSVVDWNNAFWQSSQSWTIYSVSGITTGFGNLTLNSTNWTDASGDLFGNVLSGGTFSLSQNGQDIVLNYAVPEPSTYALIGLGALALVIATRRRRA